jgi:hypothetical protein
VVDVGVGIDHRGHRSRSTVFYVERESSRGRLPADERVDNDDAGVPFDEGHDRQVVATHLLDAGDHLKQAVLDQQLALTPQTRVRRVRGRFLEKGVGIQVPDHPAILGPDLALSTAGEQTAFGVLEVLAVVKRELGSGLGSAMSGGVAGSCGHGSDGRTATSRWVRDFRPVLLPLACAAPYSLSR